MKTFAILLSLGVFVCVETPAFVHAQEPDVAESIEARYRNLILNTVEDPNSDLRYHAIDVAARRYPDADLDACIRRTLTSDPLIDSQDVSHALRLLPNSKMTSQEQTRLLLDALVRWTSETQTRTNGVVIRDLTDFLKQRPAGLSRGIAPRLKQDDIPRVLLSLAGYTQQHGQPLLDDLLKVAETSDVLRKALALNSATSVIRAIEDSVAKQQQSKAAPASERLREYARKIISRYDANGDEALTASEWDKMLMSPAAADTDGDGKITVEEYAEFLANRSAARGTD